MLKHRKPTPKSATGTRLGILVNADVGATQKLLQKHPESIRLHRVANNDKNQEAL